MTDTNSSTGAETPRPMVIGWREYLALPDWGIERIRVKVDTGARTSAIDVMHLEEIGDNWVRFDVAVARHPEPEVVTAEAHVIRRSRVKSSFGHAHERLAVETTIRLGSVEKTIELGLVNRKNMLCRMLLGRKALNGDFIVDPEHRYLVSKRKRSKRKRKRPV